MDNAKNDLRNAHPHANYRIVSNMSQKIFNKEYESDFQKRKAVPAATLKSVARQFYRENTKELIKSW